MRDVGQTLARDFFAATNWSIDNHYAHLTTPSRNLLDFNIPPGLHLALTHRPTREFASSLSLSALVPSTPVTYPPTPAPVLGPPPSPLLAGQLTYVSSSAPLSLTAPKKIREWADPAKFRQVVQGFYVGGLPVKPELREEAQPTWLAGERVDRQDYLMYGKLYAPAPRLDALYIQRFSRTVQGIITLISVPSPISPPPLTWQPNDEIGAAAAATASGAAGRLSELEFKLQQDTGRWSTEYSYAVGDSMWGARGLYNFGKSGSGEVPEDHLQRPGPRERVVDEEEEMSTGLKGRWSAGGEVYFSAQERSAGVSTGLRFSTLPEPAGATAGALPSQPPTVITATLNPIMGQLSTAYCVATSADSALGSRFDFNLFSYEADVTVGGEWFKRRGKGSTSITDSTSPSLKSWDAFGRDSPASGLSETVDLNPRVKPPAEEGDITGVLKARASTNADLALMWEGRLGSFLVSLGVVADLRLASRSGGRMNPIRSVGIGVQYWS
ncbi:hypothetical protein T439DRAFT_295573 [Meredithblackwellia eburnea MCA 4105]